MIHVEYSEVLRNLFKELLDDGYNKKQIATVVLGPQRGNQFNKFMKGGFLGLVPLTKILDSIEYNLHLVAIPKTQTEETEKITKLTEDFIEDLRFNLVEYLEMNKSKSNDTPKQYSGQVSIDISDVADDILKSL